MPGEIKSHTSIHFTDLPEWFLAGAALIYATGFLVVFTYFGSFGVQETGGDFFKVKYVHVGILCLLIQVIIATPLYSFAMLWRAARDKRKLGQPMLIPAHLPSMVLTVNMLFTFYIYAMFAPRGYVRTREHLVPLIFGITLIGLAGIRLLETKTVLLKLELAADKAIKLLDSKSVGEAARWVLCLGVILLLDRYSFHGLGQDLWAMFSGYGKFTTGGYALLLFVVFNLYVLWRTAKRAHEVDELSVNAGAKIDRVTP